MRKTLVGLNSSSNEAKLKGDIFAFVSAPVIDCLILGTRKGIAGVVRTFLSHLEIRFLKNLPSDTFVKLFSKKEVPQYILLQIA